MGQSGYRKQVRCDLMALRNFPIGVYREAVHLHILVCVIRKLHKIWFSLLYMGFAIYVLLLDNFFRLRKNKQIHTLPLLFPSLATPLFPSHPGTWLFPCFYTLMLTVFSCCTVVRYFSSYPFLSHRPNPGPLHCMCDIKSIYL